MKKVLENIKKMVYIVIESACFPFVLTCMNPVSLSWYSRTPVERPPSPMTIPLIWPYFVWRTLFSVCVIPDQRPSLRRDQRPGQMEFSPSRTTTSSMLKVYFQGSRVALQHPFPIMYYYNVVPKHLSSYSIALNFLLVWRRRYNDILKSMLHRYNVASPPALSHIIFCTVVCLIQVLWTSRIRGAVIINGSATWCFI